MENYFGFDLFAFRYGKAKITIQAKNMIVIQVDGDSTEWNKLDYDEQYEEIIEQFNSMFE